MKKFVLVPLLFTGLFFLSGSLGAQIRKIPPEVTEALKSKYPEAGAVTWKDRFSAFYASFELKGEKYEARFSSRGEWQSTENEITRENLPAEVKDGLDKSKYADWKLRSVYNIELPGNRIQYRIQVSKSDLQKKNLLFNHEGRLLKDNITL